MGGQRGRNHPLEPFGRAHSVPQDVGHFHVTVVGGTTSYENAREMVLNSFDRGILHFDLPNNYGPPPGSAEENFGRMLRRDFKHLRRYPAMTRSQSRAKRPWVYVGAALRDPVGFLVFTSVYVACRLLVRSDVETEGTVWRRAR